MWKYEKKLQYPINIKNVSPKNAQILISQFGGPDGELGASMRYLTQRYSQPFNEVKGILTDIGTEELAHMEMICTMVHQLTRGLTPEQLQTQGVAPFFTDHTLGAFPSSAGGVPFSADSLGIVGDPLADLSEDMAAEQKARNTSDNSLRVVDDPDVCDVIKFLRARVVVHFQRFGEGLRLAKERMNEKNL